MTRGKNLRLPPSNEIPASRTAPNRPIKHLRIAPQPTQTTQPRLESHQPVNNPPSSLLAMTGA
ncbi:hypothetical protein CKA32_002661 [Geitlerinema sp. FC II]|nr:hypothetical protein CKA32_002661 [Geitlerinema sp. FC II]